MCVNVRGVVIADRKSFEAELEAGNGDAAIPLHVFRTDRKDWQWCEKGAERGSARLQFELACQYDIDYKDETDSNHNSNHIAPDDQKAIYWFQRSAKQGYEPACMRLSEACEFGLLGLTRDFTAAEDLFVGLSSHRIGKCELS